VVRRSIFLILPLLVLVGLSWGRSPVPKRSHEKAIYFAPEVLPSPATMARYLGPFQLEQAWQVRSDNDAFYGYSSLIPQPDGELLAFNDAGGYLRFAPPGVTPKTTPRLSLEKFAMGQREKTLQDVESSVEGPDGQIWLGLETTNDIVRLNAQLEETGRAAPPLMSQWAVNTGAEAMARMADGRFVVVREVTRSLFDARLHEAVLFDGDPVEHPQGHGFLLDVPDNFSVVDMAPIPDGRALVLMRRLIWPMPMRFAGRIAIIDLHKVRPGAVVHAVPLASLASVLPVDNFEAIGMVPRHDGKLTVWIMSDDNHMRVLQRTLLWKLAVDPKQLPWP